MLSDAKSASEAVAKALEVLKNFYAGVTWEQRERSRKGAERVLWCFCGLLGFWGWFFVGGFGGFFLLILVGFDLDLFFFLLLCFFGGFPDKKAGGFWVLVGLVFLT